MCQRENAMYINQRDQVNYHGVLKNLRKLNKVKQLEVCQGVCSESGMNRFEKGNRIAEKLIGDRLTARLGESGEKYEDYLQPKEFVRWEQRISIVKAIENRDLETAKILLSSYESQSKLNCVNLQFIETMRYMILSIEGESEYVLLDVLKRALKFTVKDTKKALNGAHLLCDQEIHLIAEITSISSPYGTSMETISWRMQEYEKLISYMENSCWETLQKAKVYPKVVYFIYKLLLTKEPSETEIRKALELCHSAIELLRDCSRLYYFIELTEARRELMEKLKLFKLSDTELSRLEEILHENNEWERVLKELYEEYHVKPYMSDFCYLYYETECHNMVHVIETRRKMFGLSRVKLADGICTDRTLVRVEREGKNPTIEIVRRMFEKMGLCAEYRRARVVTNDMEAMKLSIEVTRNMNNYDFEAWKKNLEALENKLNMDIPHNMQEISRLNAVMKLGLNSIDEEEFYKISKESLEFTLPTIALGKENNFYFTRSEITGLFDLAFSGRGELSNRCLDIIMQEYGDIIYGKEIQSVQLCVYEFVTGELESFLGNIGEFEKSNLISKRMLKECLSNKRIGVLADNLYNMIWNYKKTNQISSQDDSYIQNMLYKCYVISKIIRRKDRITFFQHKLH